VPSSSAVPPAVTTTSPSGGAEEGVPANGDAQPARIRSRSPRLARREGMALESARRARETEPQVTWIGMDACHAWGPPALAGTSITIW